MYAPKTARRFSPRRLRANETENTHCSPRDQDWPVAASIQEALALLTELLLILVGLPQIAVHKGSLHSVLLGCGVELQVLRLGGLCDSGTKTTGGCPYSNYSACESDVYNSTLRSTINAR